MNNVEEAVRRRHAEELMKYVAGPVAHVDLRDTLVELGHTPQMADKAATKALK